MSADNQVMNETLSVIDEHITDMHTPRQSFLGTSHQNSRDGSIYGAEAPRRLSYINGHETDEEDNHLHTDGEVMLWSPTRVAEYLEDNGVEKEHCRVFQEQEISGEVLLAMEQSAIFIKEFELGSVGRRLKTWQKVKVLQDECRATASPGIPRSVSDYSTGGDDSLSDLGRTRSASNQQANFRASNATSGGNGRLNQRSATMPLPQDSGAAPQAQPMSPISPRPESMVRPSAASIRSMNHSRRHSSIDQGISNDIPASPAFPLHRKQHSYDRLWSSGAPDGASHRRTTSARSGGHTYSLSGSGLPSQAPQGYGLGPAASPTEIDRGYFSGNELDNRNRRNVLQKRSSTMTSMHSRGPSTATDPGASDSLTPTVDGASPSEPVSPLMSMKSMFGKGNQRAVSSPKPLPKPLRSFEGSVSPVVTKLDYGASPSIADNTSPAMPGASSDTSSVNPSPSPASHTFSFFSKPRATGLRVTSDAVTQSEKAGVAQSSGLKGSPIVSSPTRTGSTTPSTETRSFETQKEKETRRTSAGSFQGLAPPPPTQRARPKSRTKKTTSAYTRGLQKLTPAEQMIGCDYSGWMKKKSSTLMGTWKPRLFILRGRRLSYYYSEDDTEEKGLIDISGHRVLPAENEKITGLHAQLTGASSASPISPQSASTRLETSAAMDLANHPPEFPNSDAGLFIFKLVPPREGLSKAVSFTKPMTHYLAVNSRQEGRLWMAALMKATIDYDSSGKVTTSYNQATISLAKARARKERPPALKDDSPRKTMAAELDGTNGTVAEGQGLGIGGLDPTGQKAAGATVAGTEGNNVNGESNGNVVPTVAT